MGNRGKNDSERLLQQLYFRLMPVQVITLFINTINAFIDSLITSRYLGTEAMAAIGLFAPVSALMGMAYVLISGVQVLCSNHLGRGDTGKVSSLFSTCLVVLGGAGILIGALCFAFRAQLAAFLGAAGNAAPLLEDYIAGCSIGIVAQVLSGLLMSILPLNNDSRMSMAGTVVMIVTNVSLDLVFAICTDMGTLGMGLATSISYLLSAGLLMSSFLKKNKLVRFSFRSLRFGDMPSAARLGMPSLLFNAGCTVKSFVLNQVLLSTGSIAAIAAMSVLNNICSILGAIPCGSAKVAIILGGIYYGEEDRRNMCTLLKTALAITASLSIVVTAALMLGSSAVSSLFYAPHTEAWIITRRMLMIFPSFLVFNSIYGIFTNLYQCQGQVGFVNVMSFAENILIALLSALGVGVLGSDAVWLAFPLSEILCVLAIAASVFIRHGGVTFTAQDWLKLAPDFGVDEQDRIDISVTSMDSVIQISEQIVAFCNAKGLDRKTCMLSGLSVEEMAGNIVRHGFKGQHRPVIDIRVIYKNGGVTIRLRDNCRAFDPLAYTQQFVSDDPAANIGIRMICGLARDVVYLNNIGMNVLLVKV
ncbi:MAG: ATP-binding protein [Clostridia bacterium]|nr:ATP-binding protein [Clostridia bacterium]